MDSTIVSKLGGALLKAGAPMLKSLVEGSIGGIGGKLAGAAVDALAESLGTAKTPEAVADKIENDPIVATPIVQRVEAETISTVEKGVGDLTQYVALLQADQKSEGIISRIWRPLFAIVFTIVYAIVMVTICWLLWTRQLGTLAGLENITSFLTFGFIAACAVLGIQIYQREKTERTTGQ